jgi:hypothetical protein
MSFDLRIEANDLKINPDGTIQTVRDNEKLIQDIVKALLTTLGSNRFHNWYGSVLAASMIGQVLDSSLAEIEAERAISNTLSNIIALQKAQAQIQYVSAGETIASIRDISVVRDETDPRQYQITVAVLTKKLTIVEETFSLTVG